MTMSRSQSVPMICKSIHWRKFSKYESRGNWNLPCWYITRPKMVSKASKNYVLDLRKLPRLTFWAHKIKTSHASNGILELNNKSPPCLTWISPNNNYNKLRNNPCLSPWPSIYPILSLPHGLALPFLRQI